MKKHIARFLLLSAVIFLASACAKDEFQSLKKGNSLVFKGRIESTDTRTVVLTDGTEGKVYWVDGDEVRINGIPYLATVDEEDPRSATFNKKDENDPDPEPYEGMYYATYSCTYDPEIEVGQLPPSQYYADNSPMSAPMFAQSESSDLFLSFKNINALLEITLKGTGTVRSIKLSSENVGMTGKYAVKDGQSAYIVDEDMKPVTLFCISGVPLTEEGVKFYVSIPSGKYEALKVLITDMAGYTWETTSKNTAEVESNKIYPLTFEPSFPISDFTGFAAKYTDDGGANWYAAESLSEAIEKIAGKNKSRSIIEVLEDSELGENELPDLSGKKFTIVGNGKTWDISERTKEFVTDAATDVKFESLIIDGKNAENEFRLAYNNGTLTFGLGAEVKNVIFANPSSGACGVIYNYIGATLNINGAYIHDCASTSTGTVSGGLVANYGGHIAMDSGTIENCKCIGEGTIRGGFFYSTYMTDAAKSVGTAAITGGTIKGCEAINGGAIYSYAGKGTISNVTFSGCKASGSAAVIYAYSYSSSQTSTWTFSNCKFENCTAANGGVFRQTASSASLTFDGCSVKNCSVSDSGGFGELTAGTITVKGGSKIENCSADFGGCFSVDGGTFNLENSTVTGCYLIGSGSGGTGYIDGGAVNLVNSTVYGTNIYLYKAGTLTLDNTDFTYTGTGYGLYGSGTSSAGAGVINVKNGSSVKATKGSCIYDGYCTVNVNNSELTAAGSYCLYLYSYGKGTLTNACAVNTKDGGYAVYSGTTNSNSKLTIASGYYSATNITGVFNTTNTNNRIYISGGYFANNAINTKTQYNSGVKLTSITPVTKEIGGVTYSFPYQAKK